MTSLVYVDSRAAYRAARAAGHDAIVTDVPPLAALPDVPGLRSIAGLIGQAEANAAGEIANRVALAVDESLRTSSLPAALGLIPDMVQTAGGFTRIMSSLLHRAGALAIACDRAGTSEISLFVHDTPWLAPGQLLTPDRFASPFPALAERGFFASTAVSSHAVSGTGVAARAPEVGVTGLRRYAHLPASLLVGALLERVSARLPGRSGRRLVIGIENETIREAIPWLIARGFRPDRIGRALLQARAGDAVSPPFADVEAICHGPIAEGLKALDWLTPARGAALATLLRDHLAHGLADMASRMPDLRRRVATTFGRNHEPGVLLTNGLFGVLGGQLYGVLREHGVTVLDCEHGVTTGLSEHSQRKIAFSEASTADHVLVCSPNAATAFAQARRSADVQRHVVGLPEQVRKVVRRPLQRLLQRRRLGVGPREDIVMHVSTWPFSGNMRPGYGTPTDDVILDFDRTLLEQVYPAIPKTVIFKNYPTYRYPDEPGYPDIVRSAPNVRFSPGEDLRYLRAAADVIVTASPTSTLGWVAGSGVPVVWLSSALINPVMDAWQDSFSEAFLCVDIDTEGWADRLRDLLRRPLREIEAMFEAGRPVREQLYRDAIFGPDAEGGRRAARTVAGIVDNARRMRSVADTRAASADKAASAPS